MAIIMATNNSHTWQMIMAILAMIIAILAIVMATLMAIIAIIRE